MDVYVVSNFWYREGATVVGAATDLSSAQQIADRLESNPELRGDWASWCRDDSTRETLADEGKRWTREALTKDGQVHDSMSQEIVRVPLAGMVTAGQFSPELRERINRQVARMSVTFTTGQMWNGEHDPIEDMRRASGDDLARLGYAQEISDIGRDFGAP